MTGLDSKKEKKDTKNMVSHGLFLKGHKPGIIADLDKVVKILLERKVNVSLEFGSFLLSG